MISSASARRPSLSWAVLLGLALVRVAAAGEVAYVTTGLHHKVVAIDVDRRRVLQEIPLSLGTSDIALSPDGQTAYVVNRDTAALDLIDLRRVRRLGSIPIGATAHRVAVHPDGRRAIATSPGTFMVDLLLGMRRPFLEGETGRHEVVITGDGRRAYIAGSAPVGDEADHGAVVVDMETGETSNLAPDFSAYGAALSPSEDFLFLAGNRPSRAQARIRIVDTRSHEVLLDVPIMLTTWRVSLADVVISHDGATAYVADSFVPHIYAIDTSTGELRRPIWTPGTAVGGVKRLVMSPVENRLYVTSEGALSVIDTTRNRVVAMVPVGTRAVGVAVSADGREVYAAAEDGFYIVNAETLRVRHKVPAGTAPRGVAASADGSTLYVANQRSGSVTVVDTRRGYVTRSIRTGGSPFGIALSPDGGRAYVTSYEIPGAVFIIDTATGTLEESVHVPGEAQGIAVSPDGARLFVSNYYWGAMAIIDTAAQAVSGYFPGGLAPQGVAVTGDGRLGMNLAEPSELRLFDPRSEIPDESPIDRIIDMSISYPERCAVAPTRDGRRAYAVGLLATAIDLEEGAVFAETNLGFPYSAMSCGLALTADDSEVWVANFANDLVTVLDADDLEPVRQIPVPPLPFGIVMTCGDDCPPSPPAPLPSCRGDCGGDGTLTVEEVARGTAIRLRSLHPETCPPFWRGHVGGVTSEVLSAAVDGALRGCIEASKD